MTMISFRLADSEAADAQAWADALGVHRSELLRAALRAHVARLAAERDARVWELAPRTDDEAAVGALADWGPAEDWSDWDDAPR